MHTQIKKQLLKTLNNIVKEDLTNIHVVLLPDFFVDHLLFIPSVEKMFQAIEDVASAGGGNIPGISQRITQGGNAANSALALAKLGVSTHLICRTDPLGAHLLQYFLGKNNVDLSGVKTDGELAITTALEFQQNQANVMIGDAGSVANFTFESLTDQDYERIASSNLVAVTNWNLNHSGTLLATQVFEYAKRHNVRTFFDSGDPSPRVKDIPELKQKVLTNPKLDILCLNENELRYYSNSNAVDQQQLIASVLSLKKDTPARIDLHTSLFSCSALSTPVVIPTPSLSKIFRFTGAGDAWNAANIFADLIGFADDERLLFANVFAGIYITSVQPVHPTIDMVIKFIQNNL